MECELWNDSIGFKSVLHDEQSHDPSVQHISRGHSLHANALTFMVAGMICPKYVSIMILVLWGLLQYSVQFLAGVTLCKFFIVSMLV